MSLTLDHIRHSNSLDRNAEREAQENYYSMEKRLGPNQIIHRSLHSIIRNNMHSHNAKRELEIAEEQRERMGCFGRQALSTHGGIQQRT